MYIIWAAGMVNAAEARIIISGCVMTLVFAERCSLCCVWPLRLCGSAFFARVAEKT